MQPVINNYITASEYTKIRLHGRTWITAELVINIVSVLNLCSRRLF